MVKSLRYGLFYPKEHVETRGEIDLVEINDQIKFAGVEQMKGYCKVASNRWNCTVQWPCWTAEFRSLPISGERGVKEHSERRHHR